MLILLQMDGRKFNIKFKINGRIKKLISYSQRLMIVSSNIKDVRGQKNIKYLYFSDKKARGDEDKKLEELMNR